jgi:hypothetical protein
MAKAKSRAVPHNSVSNFVNQFTHPFTIDGAFIDCKDMSLNYTDGLIPLADLAGAVDAAIGKWQGQQNYAFNLMNLTPRFEMVSIDKVVSHPAFNRDTSPNHCYKLELEWLDQFAMTGLGLKMPDHYGGQVLNGDSTHTGVNRIRKGDTELPFWLADIPDQGSYADTLALGKRMVGELFLAINVRNKRGVDIFDQHFIKVACNIAPAPQIDAVVNSVKGVLIKRAGNKIAGAIHNLNETYITFDLDKKSSKPGTLLKTSLQWFVRNFKNQSIDGCLMTSFAMFVQDNDEAGITITNAQADQLAALLIKRYKIANKSQLAIKDSCNLLNRANPNYQPLDSNYVVSNGLKHLAHGLGIPSVRDQINNWAKGF